MATLSSVLNAIKFILQDNSYTDPIIISKINLALANIAGGVRMPNGEVSQPLPDLFTYGTVTTSVAEPYVRLPEDFQRRVVNVYDSMGVRINAPSGGGYEAVGLFLRRVADMRLMESGSVYAVAVQGKRLYYQGVPSTPEIIGLQYYRLPTALTADADEPDCLPFHLQERLLKHYVLMEIFGEALEDGHDNRGVAVQYHQAKFYEAMTDLIDFNGYPDAQPLYYGGGGNFVDLGAVDG